MPRSEIKTSRRHIQLYDEDWEFLMEQYGPSGARPEVGTGGAIRAIVHAKVVAMREKLENKFDTIRKQIKAGEAEK